MAFGATKKAEYRRSAELFEQIFKDQGAYFALAFLYDSQYTREDIGKIMELIKPINYNHLTKKAYHENNTSSQNKNH